MFLSAVLARLRLISGGGEQMRLRVAGTSSEIDGTFDEPVSAEKRMFSYPGSYLLAMLLKYDPDENTG